MADFGHNNKAIKKQKIFKPIAHGGVTDFGMVTLTEEPLLYQKNLKDNEILNVNLE